MSTHTSSQNAASEFARMVKNVQNQNGWDFVRAWDYCRSTEKTIFNRMAGAQGTEVASKIVNREKIASEALSDLADDHRQVKNCSFAIAWKHVCNRRRDLCKLSNKLLPESAWNILADTAFDRFTDGATMRPDGMRIEPIADNESRASVQKGTRAEFFKLWDSTLRQNPGLTPAGLWDKIKAEYPNTFWPFVAMTGHPGEDSAQS